METITYPGPIHKGFLGWTQAIVVTENCCFNCLQVMNKDVIQAAFHLEEDNFDILTGEEKHEENNEEM